MLGKKRSVLNELEVEDVQFRLSRQWDQLHQPLLEMILHCLSVPDYFRFPGVCHSWLKVHSDNRSFTSLASKVPWLLLHKAPCHKMVRLFYNLPDKRTYQIPLPLEPPPVARHNIVASSHGWVLVAKALKRELRRINRRCEHFLVHPISGVKIQLPLYEGEWNRHLVALSSAPTDPNCVVAVPNWKGFALCRLGDKVPEWTTFGTTWTGVPEYGPYYSNEADYLDYIRDVAFYGDRFYGLTREGNIVVLNHNTAELEKLHMDCRQLPTWPNSFLNSLLVCQGEVFFITAGDLNLDQGDIPPDVRVQVFQADLSVMAWVRVWSLGERQVFLSETGSVSVRSSNCSPGEHRGNHIYVAHPSTWYLFEKSRSSHNKWCFVDYDLKDGATHYHKIPDGTEQRSLHPLTWVEPSLA